MASLFAISSLVWMSQVCGTNETATIQTGDAFVKRSRSSLDFIAETFNIPRSDSEFSLGLNRNKSIPKELNTLGPLCDTGQIIVFFLKYGSLALLVGVGAATVLTHETERTESSQPKSL
jgi:hypothetical protein